MSWSNDSKESVMWMVQSTERECQRVQCGVNEGEKMSKTLSKREPEARPCQ